jgi:hypothetical protein
MSSRVMVNVGTAGCPTGLDGVDGAALFAFWCFGAGLEALLEDVTREGADSGVKLGFLAITPSVYQDK